MPFSSASGCCPYLPNRPAGQRCSPKKKHLAPIYEGNLAAHAEVRLMLGATLFRASQELYQSNGVYSTTFLTLVRPVLGWPPWQDPGHYWTPTAKRPKWPRGS